MRINEVDDYAWFAGAAVSDLERRDRDVDGERIGKERTAGGAKFTFEAKKVVNDSWIGPGRTVIVSSLDRQSAAGISDQPAKLKEVTQGLVGIIMKTVVPFKDVEARGDRKEKREGIEAGRSLKPRMESN